MPQLKPDAGRNKPLARSLEAATRIAKGDYAYVVHPLLDGVPRCDPAMLRAFVAWAKGQPCLRGATVLAAPEAMALPLAAALSLETGIPYTVLRKRQYGLPGEVAAASTTGYGASTLYLNDLTPQDRIVVVDNVLSTGGTLRAILRACADAKLDAVGAVVFVDKGSARKAIEAESKLPVAVMHTLRVDRDGVHVLD